MILVGIYPSAISVAEDTHLRKSIRNFTLRQSRLLEGIGSAEVQQEIEKRVIALTKQNQDRMEEETGIQSPLSEEEMREFLQQVIMEVKGKANNNKKDKDNCSIHRNVY